MKNNLELKNREPLREAAFRKKLAIAAWPENQKEALDKAAVDALRRPPVSSPDRLRKTTTAAKPKRAKTEYETSIYSAEEIVASLNVPSPSGSAEQMVRTETVQRYLPVSYMAYAVFAICGVLMLFQGLQFSRLVALRYEVANKTRVLATLQHQRDELLAEQRKTENIYELNQWAVSHGMSFPKEFKKLSLVPAGKSVK